MYRVLIAVLALSIPGVAGASEANLEVTMENTHWQLVRYLDESGQWARALSKPEVDIVLEGGELGGSAGCNRYFGGYELDGEKIRFTSQMGSTQMACVPAVTEQEQRYLALLPQATSWSVENDHLTLMGEDSKPLLELAVAEPTPLEDIEWQASGINNGKGGVQTTANTHLTTAVFSDGTISGSTGCNRYNGSYDIKGERIVFGPAAATRKFCAEPEGIMEQEQQFLAALEMASTFQVTPGKLELRDENGSLQISFRTYSD